MAILSVKFLAITNNRLHQGRFQDVLIEQSNTLIGKSLHYHVFHNHLARS